MSLVQPRPHAPLELQPMHVPTPGPGRVVVRVAAATMNSLDHKILAYAILAQEWPWVGGNEYAGTVAAVGPSVENLKVGDRVVAAAVNFVEGQQVSGWQEYALLRADLCAKIPDHVPFDKACTTPTAFAAASVALALELGLKYPEPPPAPPKQSAASIWEDAMAALGNGATFGWDLEDGIVEGGAWYPKPTVQAIQAPLSPAELAKRAEAERTRQEEERRRAKAREEEEDRLHAELTRAMAEEIERRVARARADARPPHARYQVPLSDAGDPWANVHPMLWGAGDMSREAMDRHWGSGWEDGHRRFELVDDCRNVIGLGLITNGLGLTLGPVSGAGGTMARDASGGTDSASGSTSASMGRSSSDSNTSVSASDAPGMWSSYPSLPPVCGLLPARRGSEPSLRVQEPAATWVQSTPVISQSAVKSGPGGSPVRPRSGDPASVRPRSSGSAPSKPARPQAASGIRGSTSPFRIPATLSHRGNGRGRGSPPYRVREQSPLGDRFGFGKRELEPSQVDRPIGGHTLFSTAGRSYQPLGGAPVGVADPWSMSGARRSDTFFPPPLARTENPVYVLDEPILVWGGSTCVGRSALQLLKRAGYTNLFVVAASERHAELARIAPGSTKFFDYHHSNVVDQIRAALGGQKLDKVLDTVSMPHTLEPIAQLVSAGSKLAALLPVNTPMPKGVEIKPVMFGRCNDYTGKDVLSFTFGKEKMWPLLSELLHKDEWVYHPMIHLRGELQACATSAMQMMSAGEHAGKRLVFDIAQS